MKTRIIAFIVLTLLYVTGCVLFAIEYEYSKFVMYLIYFPYIIFMMACPLLWKN